MKAKFTLLLILMLAHFATVMAAAPTTASRSLVFPVNQLEGDRFTMSFTKGNGAFRLIVIKEGSAITTQPVNGMDYTNASSQYGAAGTAFNGDDGFVVFRGSNNNTSVALTVTHLQPNTTYYVSIWEFNGSGAGTEYLLTAATGSVTTKTAPTSQATIGSFTNVAGNRLTVNWTGGNGENTLVVARKGAAVNATPEQLKKYTASSEFRSGSAINGDNYVVYQGNAASASITNLEPNTVYYFAVFEFNGSEGPVYKIPGNTGSQLTNAGPTQPSGNISIINVEGNRLTLSFGPGNGTYHLIVGRKGQAVTAVPQNGQTYTAGAAYGSGYMFPTGDFVLNTTDNERTFTNLDPSSTYYFRVCDYDIDANGNTYYLTSSYSEKSGSTAFPPQSQPSGVYFENITGTSATIKYAAGISSYRMVVMKADGPVDATPADLTRYNGNSVFGKGPFITPGNYIIYGQTNTNTATVTGLTPGVTYHVAVWGFNGNNYPVYGTPPATGSFTIPNEPSAAATNFSVTAIEGNSFRGVWSGGDGASRIMVVRKGGPVTAKPADGVVYRADKSFQHGDIVGADQYVVYDGTTRVVSVENLEIGAIYYFAIFEYNLAGGVPDYLTSAYLEGNQPTVSVPTAPVSALSVSEMLGTAAKINYTVGNGSGRLFLMRANSPVNAEPQDFVDYSSSGTYGSVQLGNTGNYIVSNSTSMLPFKVSGLTPGTRYYVTAFEYNGSMAPAFLRPGASFDFIVPGALPLKWLSFAAKEEHGVVHLNWSTAEEVNYSYFVAERSINGRDFTALDTIIAKGGGDYSYVDRAPVAGNSIYRIKQVDRDNHFEYSKIIVLHTGVSNTTLKLYPNPAAGYTFIRLPNDLQKATAQIFTQGGALIKNISVSNLQLIPLGDLPAGVYYISLKEDQGSSTARLIIQ